MAYEIEHKYLVTDTGYKSLQSGEVDIRQGYLSRDADRTVRVRIKGDEAFLTVKTRNIGDMRHEFEYRIPVEDAEAMLAACIPPIISKTRHYVPFEGHLWEVDEFHGLSAPLTVAEIELRSSDEQYALPPFVGKNVTGDPAYYNSNLG